MQRFHLIKSLARHQTASNLRFLSSSPYANIPLAPPDPILGLNDAFLKDDDSRKVNLGVGAYRDDAGQPYVLPSVRAAEKQLIGEELKKEYLPITGLASFVDKALVFAYGEDFVSSNRDRIAATQSLSGTGACRIASEFMNTFSLATGNVCYQPNPTWGNHVPIFKKAGMDVDQYPYYDKANNALDFEGLMGKIKSVDNGSLFLVHACAHNPTGMDPTKAQWEEMSKAMKEKDHLVLMDCAYQGFASGDAEDDAFAIRLFVEDGNKVCLAQSFAKNFGLYGERVGAFSIVCQDAEEKARVESQLKLVVRPMYSNPPVNGARIIDKVLGDSALTQQWREECDGMASRIKSMRRELTVGLEKAGSTLDWSHIEKQIGMFCYTGLNKEQVEQMKGSEHVYMTADGRISMAGVTTGNVEYLSNALHEVTK
eukprot:augustus_masked-scaffold_11-processed-gene-12.70-mRNA-1 protein AED:0.29 eAED:0.29 QI:0/-1/0/1/-1/1/1/0/425